VATRGESSVAGGVAVVAIALLARTLEAVLETTLFNDGPRFVAMAVDFLAGDWRHAIADSFHPLTALFMAAGHAALGLSLEAAGETVSVLSGGVAAYAVWALAREQLGDRVALVAGVIFAMHPRLRESSAGVQSDGLHLACFALAALHAWRALDRARLASAALAGVFTALAYLTRPEGLATAVVLAGWLAADLLLRRRTLGRTLGLGSAFALTLALVSAPYVWAMHEVSGHWSITRKKEIPSWPQAAAPGAASVTPPVESPPPADAGQPVPPLPPPAEPDPALSPSIEPPSSAAAPPPLADAEQGPGELLRDGLRGIHPVLLILTVLGLATILRAPSHERRAAAYSLSFFALFVGVLLVLHLVAGYVSRRHFLPAAAMLMPLAGQGTRTLGQLVLGRVPRLGKLSAATLLGWAIVIGMGVEMALPKGEDDKQARRAAALWLREHHAPDRIATHRARDAYYGGASEHVQLDESVGVEEMLRGARARGVRFVILDTGTVAKAAPPEWAHILHRTEYRGNEVWVLELVP
jgi:4-amino-4-deoxy-L-arabinose transferase-like glycosyltransferase